MSGYQPYGMGPCPNEETLAALLDGALGDAERAEVEAHALACDTCREALADGARALETLGEAPAERPRVLRVPMWLAAAAAVAIIATPVVWVVRGGSTDRPIDRSTDRPIEAPPEQAPPLVVAEVSGPIEVRDPFAMAAWRPLAPGDSIRAGAEVRLTDHEPATVVFESGVSLALRGRLAGATLHPGAGSSLDVRLESGAIAASPAPGAATPIRIQVPQGTIASAGAGLEVHVERRRGTLVIARDMGGVVCATPRGEVHVDAGNHTLLFNDRPPMPARPVPSRHRGWGGGDHRKGGGRSRCSPPAGPEVEGLFKEGIQ